MKKKESYLLIHKFLDCFFLLNKKTFDLSNVVSFFCLIQQNRELKQLIKVLMQIKKIQVGNHSKISRVVFHVEDLFIKDFLTLLTLKCNLNLKITSELFNSASSQNFSTRENILNIYLVSKKNINSLYFKSRHCNIVFDNAYNFKVDFSGCYSVGSSTLDTKTLIFIVSLLNSFLSADYEKIFKV